MRRLLLSPTLLVLALFTLCGVANASSTTLVSGGTISDIFEVANDVDTYDFTGEAGDYVLIQVSETISGYGYIYIYGPDGSLKTSGNNVAGLTLPDNGRYTAMVKISNGNTGDYTIEYFNSTETVENGILTSGGTISDTFDRKFDFDTYEFTGEAGDYAHIQVSETISGYGYIYIYGPDGSLKTSGNNVAGLTLPDNGRYTAMVKISNGKTGDYTIEYFNSTETVENGSLIDEASIYSSFDRKFDFDTYKFSGDWGDSVHISISENISGYAAIYVYKGVSGNLVKSGNNSVDFTLSEGTHYTVLVRVSNGNTGDYTIYYDTTPFFD